MLAEDFWHDSAMNKPGSAPDRVAYQRLGALVADRRRKLGLRQDNLPGGPSSTTVTLIENGEMAGPLAYKRLEGSLLWRQGSIDRILQGGDAELLTAAEARSRLERHAEVMDDAGDDERSLRAVREFQREQAELTRQMFGDRRQVALEVREVANQLIELLSTPSSESRVAELLDASRKLLHLSSRLSGQEMATYDASSPKAAEQLRADLDQIGLINQSLQRLDHIAEMESQHELEVAQESPAPSQAVKDEKSDVEPPQSAFGLAARTEDEPKEDLHDE